MVCRGHQQLRRQRWCLPLPKISICSKVNKDFKRTTKQGKIDPDIIFDEIPEQKTGIEKISNKNKSGYCLYKCHDCNFWFTNSIKDIAEHFKHHEAYLKAKNNACQDNLSCHFLPSNMVYVD